MSRPPFTRRRFLVNRFQLTLVAWSFLYQLAIAAVLYGAGVVTLVLSVNDKALSARERGESAQVLLHLHHEVLPSLLPLAIAVALHSVLVSHRIAGPIYRFTRVMRDVAGGDLTMNVRLRRKDYLKQEARELNAMIGGLNEPLRTAQLACAEATRAERRLERALSDVDEAHEAREAAERLRACVAEVDRELASFRTRAPTRFIEAGPRPASGADSDDSPARPAA